MCVSMGGHGRYAVRVQVLTASVDTATAAESDGPLFCHEKRTLIVESLSTDNFPKEFLNSCRPGLGLFGC